MQNSKHNRNGGTKDASSDATDSEEPPGPASRQAQHLHWSPGPPTSGARTRQTPTNNTRVTANARHEPRSNAQEHPRRPPEGPGGVSQPPRTASTHVQSGQTKVAEMRPQSTLHARKSNAPTEARGQAPQPISMTSTRVLGQTETAPATRPTCENEPADALATANREALLPRTGIYETTPMTIGEASRQHQSSDTVWNEAYIMLVSCIDYALDMTCIQSVSQCFIVGGIL